VVIGGQPLSPVIFFSGDKHPLNVQDVRAMVSRLEQDRAILTRVAKKGNG
jgi:hypothetical protein